MAELTRITNADMVGHKVEELADVPNISTTALKRRFDSLTTDVVVPKFNELAESLEAWDIDHRVSSEAITNIKMDEDDNIVVSKDGGETYEKSNSSGHKIMNGAGIVFPAENRLQFSDNVVIIDDPENRKTFLSIPSGIKGDKGDSATIKVGTVEQGEEASIENVGSEQDAIFDFTLPKGDKGDAATVTVGVTTTGEAGSQAQVTNSGTQQAATFNFVIPKGDKGDPGTGLTLKDTYASLSDLQIAHPTGSEGDAYLVGDEIESTVYLWSTTTHAWENVGQLKGEQGEHGLAGSIQFGIIEGVAQGSEYVQNVGTPQNAILNMGLPIGDKGDKGDAATISIGTVTKGTEARVTNSGTSTNAVFNFVLPKGDQGEQGNPSVVNGKSGNSIILYGTDIVVSEEDNTPLSEMTGGGKAYTTEEWEDLDHDDIADGTQIIITDDYSSTICSTISECEASENLDDVAGASALAEISSGISALTNSYIETESTEKTINNYTYADFDELTFVKNGVYLICLCWGQSFQPSATGKLNGTGIRQGTTNLVNNYTYSAYAPFVTTFIYKASEDMTVTTYIRNITGTNGSYWLITKCIRLA